MQTIKTGVVVALLLAVCYGAFVALNAPEPNLPEELLSEFDWNPDDAGLDNLLNIEIPDEQSLSSAFPQSQAVPQGVATSTVQMPDITIPSLPTFPNGSSAPLGQSPGLPANQFSLGPNTSSTGSPAMAGTTELPTFDFPTAPATADGPSVSLGDATAPANPSRPADNLAVTPGQLISQPIGEASSPLPPLLGTPEANPQSEKLPTLPFADAKTQALQLSSNGKLRDALQMLSQYYDSPELTSAEHSDLVDLLDALSREVIYSPRHLADPAYTVVPGDTLESLAEKHQITPELLAAINRLGTSKALVSGSQVKTLPGPFRSIVSIGRQELTLFMGDLYAGRFPISLGKDPTPVEGNFEVVSRSRDRTYYGTGGKILDANDNRNPYGGYWLDLGKELCIHGTPEMGSEELRDAGCISLAPLDAADVYNILGQGSQVSIIP